MDRILKIEHNRVRITNLEIIRLFNQRLGTKVRMIINQTTQIPQAQQFLYFPQEMLINLTLMGRLEVLREVFHKKAIIQQAIKIN
jgi:hypothetical protein